MVPAVRTMLLPEAMCGVQDCNIAVLSGSLRVFRHFKMSWSLTVMFVSCCHNFKTNLPQRILTLRYTLFYLFL